MHQSKTNEGMEGKQENGQSNNKAILPLFHIIILAIMLVITVLLIIATTILIPKIRIIIIIAEMNKHV